MQRNAIIGLKQKEALISNYTKFKTLILITKIHAFLNLLLYSIVILPLMVYFFDFSYGLKIPFLILSPNTSTTDLSFRFTALSLALVYLSVGITVPSLLTMIAKGDAKNASLKTMTFIRTTTFLLFGFVSLILYTRPIDEQNITLNLNFILSVNVLILVFLYFDFFLMVKRDYYRCLITNQLKQ